MSAVDKYLADLISDIKSWCPEAVVKISFSTVEGEDADIHVYVPDGLRGKLHDKIAGKTFDLLVDKGVSIVTFMHSLEEASKV